MGLLHSTGSVTYQAQPVFHLLAELLPQAIILLLTFRKDRCPAFTVEDVELYYVVKQDELDTKSLDVGSMPGEAIQAVFESAILDCATKAGIQGALSFET